MKKSLFGLSVIASIFFSGCGEPKLDCTTEQSCEESKAAILKGLDKKSEMQLSFNLSSYPMTYTVSELTNSSSATESLSKLNSQILTNLNYSEYIELDSETKAKYTSNPQLYKLLDGKTANEINEFMVSHKTESKQAREMQNQWRNIFMEIFLIKTEVKKCLLMTKTENFNYCVMHDGGDVWNLNSSNPNFKSTALVVNNSDTSKAMITGFNYGENYIMMIVCGLEIDSNHELLVKKCKIKQFNKDDMTKINIPCINPKYCKN